MKILVFGAGAVGQAIGCMLAASGHTVDLIVRPRFAKVINESGLAVEGIFGRFKVGTDRIRAFSSIEECIDRHYNYVLLTTKSYDTADALTELEKLTIQQFKAVSLQNGCGNLEQLVEVFGKERSLGGRVITGFTIDNPGQVRITVTADDVHIGGPDEGMIPESAETIAAAINDSGLPCRATPTIQRDLFAKLLYNCALNPLGAALGVHYGALGDDPQARSVMDSVIGEVFAVIEAMGGRTHWQNAVEYRDFFYEKQIPATYDHRSSMLQDIEKGKRTEVEALTGYVGAEGGKRSVPTPVCDTLSAIIRFKSGI